jgi:hypothetical protein
MTLSGCGVDSLVLPGDSALCRCSLPYGRNSSQSDLFATPGMLTYHLKCERERALA